MTIMQITLVQPEIEQVLTDYITSQVSINSGMHISIDLRAGRGVDGFTATIDIVHPEHAAAAQILPEAAPVIETAPKKVTKPVAAKPAPVEEPEAEVVEEVEAEAESVAEEAVDHSPVEEATATEEAPAAPKKSLFSGLQKPNNG